MKQTAGSDLAPQAAPAGSSDRATRWANVVVWGIVTFLITTLGVLLIPLTSPGGVRIPIAPVVPLVANIWLPRVFLRGTGWGWSRAVPAVMWAFVAVTGAAPTAGGDLLIPSNSYSSITGLAYLAVGAMSAIIGLALARTDLSTFRKARAGTASATGPRAPGGAD